jgi:hypothetical protein
MRMSRRTSFVVLILTVLVLVTFAAGQTLPASDPQALSYVAQSITALTGGNTVGDVTLTGNATWIDGSDNETGPATLYAKGVTEK